MNFVAFVASSNRLGSRSGPSARSRRISHLQGTSERVERTSLSRRRLRKVMSSTREAAFRRAAATRCRCESAICMEIWDPDALSEATTLALARVTSRGNVRITYGKLRGKRIPGSRRRLASTDEIVELANRRASLVSKESVRATSFGSACCVRVNDDSRRT